MPQVKNEPNLTFLHIKMIYMTFDIVTQILVEAFSQEQGIQENAILDIQRQMITQ